MLDKILWASYGEEETDEVFHYIYYFAKKFGAEVVAVYVKPIAYFQGAEYLPADEGRIFLEWVETRTREKIREFEKYSSCLKDEGINFRLVVKDGIPYEEILSVAKEEKAELIMTGKGKHEDNGYTMSRAVLKLIRISDVPVLVAEKAKTPVDIKNIVVPTGMYNIRSKDILYAVELAKVFDSTIYHLNVLTTAKFNLPAEVVNKLRGDAYNKIAEADIDFKNVEPKVVESIEPAKGIIDFAKKKDVDLIVMLTSSGRRDTDGFVGSVTHKVLEEAEIPVLTMKP